MENKKFNNKELLDFCKNHNIKALGREFFFEFDNQLYRISQTNVKLKRKVKDELIKKPTSSRNKIDMPIEIYGLKSDVIRIYTDITSGIKLNPETGKPEEEIKSVNLSKADNKTLSMSGEIPEKKINLSKAEFIKSSSKHTLPRTNQTRSKQEALNNLLKRR